MLTIFFLFLFCFLGPHLRHMEVPRLGVQPELQPLAYTTATATWDPSWVCNLYHCARQHRILNPLSKARDQTHILTDTMSSSQPVEPHGNSLTFFFFSFGLFRAASAAYGSSQARGQIQVTAGGLHHSHINARSEPHLHPTPQLTATKDPQPTEQGQGSNLGSHGYQ